MVGSRVRPALELARDRALEEEGERYNPISPCNGNMIIGGAHGMTSRSTRHSMADSRAMEIQMRNQTPGTGATPVMGVSQYRGGSGATPSTGLSEFRGGSMEDIREKAKELLSSGKKVTEVRTELRALFYRPMKHINSIIKEVRAEMKGVSKKKKGKKEDWEKSVENILELKEAKKLVAELKKKAKTLSDDEIIKFFNSKIIPKLDIYSAEISPFIADKLSDKFQTEIWAEYNKAHGVEGSGLSEFRGGSMDRFVGGNYGPSNVSQSGAYQGQGRRRNSSASDIMSAAHLTARELSDHVAKQHGKKYHREFMEGMMKHAHSLHGAGWWSDMFNKVKNEIVNKESHLRKHIIPKAAEYTAKAAPVINALGTAVGVPGAGTALATGAQGLHRFNEGAKAVGLGRGGRRKRAPASAGDGRRKRADIVRKVMADRGVKMIEASKIVKAEGLY